MNSMYGHTPNFRTYDSPWMPTSTSHKKRKRAFNSLQGNSDFPLDRSIGDVATGYYHDSDATYLLNRSYVADRTYFPVSSQTTYVSQSPSDWSSRQVQDLEHGEHALQSYDTWNITSNQSADCTNQREEYAADVVAVRTTGSLMSDQSRSNQGGVVVAQSSGPLMQAINHGVSNPFKDNSKAFITSLENRNIVPRVGERNGYVKFGAIVKHVPTKDSVGNDASRPQRPETKLVWEFDYEKWRRQEYRQQQQRSHPPTGLPADFMFGGKMEPIERRLFNFYLAAWCSGRTVLVESNSWKLDLGPMFTASLAVRYALLTLSAVYVLDYVPSEDMRQRANTYYKNAVAEIDKALQDPEAHQGSDGDALIAGITLLNMLDIVRWEGRRPAGEEPRWLEGAKLGAAILSSSDPGSRYYKRKNAQITQARRANTIMIGRAIVTALTVSPLDVQKNKRRKFDWLLNGDERAVNRIHAVSGFSPKLMHCFILITNLAARAALTPNSHIVPSFAAEYKTKLETLRQWSELSEGHDNLNKLFSACVLNGNGVVADRASMTDLTAEAWRVTALIYLQCRVYRLPRRHPTILDLVDKLSEIIRRMPCVGELFTAQAPFLPVWFLGLTSTEDKHRAIADNWFHTVINSTDCRSSVPPAWTALKKIRVWADANLNDDYRSQHHSVMAKHNVREDSQETSSIDTTYISSTVCSPTTLSPTVMPPTVMQPINDHFPDNGYNHDQLFTTYQACQVLGLDTTLVFDPQAHWEAFDTRPLSQRDPWWEAVINHIMSKHGYLCLI